MVITIRSPRLEEAGAIADLHVATWKEVYSHLLPSDFFTEEYVEGRHRMWHHLLTHPRADMTIHVAESGGEIIGFAWAGPGEGLSGEEPPRDRLLYAIYVLAAHYGTGAGQSLLDDVLGDNPAMLWVAKQN